MRFALARADTKRIQSFRKRVGLGELGHVGDLHTVEWLEHAGALGYLDSDDGTLVARMLAAAAPTGLSVGKISASA